MRLEAATRKPPPGVEALLADLGDGENGFGGTPVPSGKATLDEFLQRCCAGADPALVPAGLVPQTVYWVLNDAGRAIGMVRMRHYLNDNLRVHGGHIGYFIRHDQRGQGHATAALGLALAELRRLGEPRALVTVNADNLPSIKVIEANGGRRIEEPAAAVIGDNPGATTVRYWIELDAGQGDAV